MDVNLISEVYFLFWCLVSTRCSFKRVLAFFQMCVEVQPVWPVLKLGVFASMHSDCCYCYFCGCCTQFLWNQWSNLEEFCCVCKYQCNILNSAKDLQLSELLFSCQNWCSAVRTDAWFWVRGQVSHSAVFRIRRRPDFAVLWPEW